MKDIKGNSIYVGDVLLNVATGRDAYDAWKHLICVEPEVIRDFNAWNLGWNPEETLIIDYWRNCTDILTEEEFARCDKYFSELRK